MLFPYPHPYPFKDGSTDKNECSNSLTPDGTKINDLSYYQKLGASIPLRREGVINTSQYQSFSKLKAKGQLRLSFESLPIRLHSTIRFYIDDNDNILTPCSKTIHTKFTKLASILNILLAG